MMPNRNNSATANGPTHMHKRLTYMHHRLAYINKQRHTPTNENAEIRKMIYEWSNLRGLLGHIPKNTRLSVANVVAALNARTDDRTDGYIYNGLLPALQKVLHEKGVKVRRLTLYSKFYHASLKTYGYGNWMRPILNASEDKPISNKNRGDPGFLHFVEILNELHRLGETRMETIKQKRREAKGLVLFSDDVTRFNRAAPKQWIVQLFRDSRKAMAQKGDVRFRGPSSRLKRSELDVIVYGFYKDWQEIYGGKRVRSS